MKKIADIIWDPVKDKMNREYLFLTYGPSSRMEYPNRWKERMEIWEDTIRTLLEIDTEEKKYGMNTDHTDESKIMTPDPILDIY